MAPVLQRPTLVLNRNWQPVNVATVARALILVWNESARVVDPTDYQLYNWSDWTSLAPKRDELFIQAVKQRRELAKENGTALWDMWEAMGGRGSMAKFKRRGLCKFDYIHFTEAGGAWVGDRFVLALWRGLQRHLERAPDSGCDVGEPGPAGGGVATPL